MNIVLSSRIVFSTIFTQSVLLVYLKNNPKHYSWTQKVTFYMKFVQPYSKTRCYIWLFILIMVLNLTVKLSSWLEE